MIDIPTAICGICFCLGIILLIVVVNARISELKERFELHIRDDKRHSGTWGESKDEDGV